MAELDKMITVLVANGYVAQERWCDAFNTYIPFTKGDITFNVAYGHNYYCHQYPNNKKNNQHWWKNEYTSFEIGVLRPNQGIRIKTFVTGADMQNLIDNFERGTKEEQEKATEKRRLIVRII